MMIDVLLVSTQAGYRLYCISEWETCDLQGRTGWCRGGAKVLKVGADKFF